MTFDIRDKLYEFYNNELFQKVFSFFFVYYKLFFFIFVTSRLICCFILDAYLNVLFYYVSSLADFIGHYLFNWLVHKWKNDFYNRLFVRINSRKQRRNELLITVSCL